ncbi:hypothetical protein JKP88DRAFT_282759 [Tribonema minus]|uniref:Cyclic nucleotide-binding domain-containing protein n=1 Tax=Tribonema minus TaxID=303371 RepID=A0A836C8T0_9STRA|nr:hypothetical protein JKP88DRAFT_282759 [Tribonema minus]
MALEGKRVAYIDEMAEGGKLDTKQFTTLNGGAQITGRDLQETQRSFYPTHMLFSNTNYMPAMDKPDPKMVRRILALPFEAKIRFVDDPDQGMRFDPTDITHFKRDGSLKVKIEAQGYLVEAFLWWVVGGACDYLEADQLPAPPQCCKDKLADIKLDNDRLQQFIDERCVEGPGLDIGCSEFLTLYNAFRRPRMPVKKKDLHADMQKKGFAKETSTGGATRNLLVYKGIRFKSRGVQCVLGAASTAATTSGPWLTAHWRGSRTPNRLRHTGHSPAFTCACMSSVDREVSSERVYVDVRTHNASTAYSGFCTFTAPLQQLQVPTFSSKPAVLFHQWQVKNRRPKPAYSVYGFEVADADACPLRQLWEGAQTVVASVGAGQVVGELELMTQSARVATLLATDDSEVLEISGSRFDEMLALNRPAANKLLSMMAKALARRLAAVNQRIIAKLPVPTPKPNNPHVAPPPMPRPQVSDADLEVLDRLWK